MGWFASDGYKFWPWVIKYTIGLVLPWWLVTILQRLVVKEDYKDEYNSDSWDIGNFLKYTLGFILPWWIVASVSSANE